MADQSCAGRLRTALALYEVGESMLRQRLLRERPQAAPGEIEDEIRAWRGRRPGAESGDFPGPASARTIPR